MFTVQSLIICWFYLNNSGFGSPLVSADNIILDLVWILGLLVLANLEKKVQE
jgi:hypothetical protein